MSHNYLLSLYTLLDQKTAEAAQTLTHSGICDTEKQYTEGRLAAIENFKTFLSQNYDIKLPRRIFKQLSNKNILLDPK